MLTDAHLLALALIASASVTMPQIYRNTKSRPALGPRQSSELITLRPSVGHRSTRVSWLV